MSDYSLAVSSRTSSLLEERAALLRDRLRASACNKPEDCVLHATDATERLWELALGRAETLTTRITLLALAEECARIVKNEISGFDFRSASGLLANYVVNPTGLIPLTYPEHLRSACLAAVNDWLLDRSMTINEAYVDVLAGVDGVDIPSTSCPQEGNVGLASIAVMAGPEADRPTGGQANAEMGDQRIPGPETNLVMGPCEVPKDSKGRKSVTNLWREQRKKSGQPASKKHLAKAVGVDPADLNRWENCKPLAKGASEKEKRIEGFFGDFLRQLAHANT